MEFDDEIREFLIESNENLANLDRELVQLEQNPHDVDLISSAFRTIHTIKGTCGFFGYDILASVTHVTENILSQVREGQRLMTPGLISLLLEAMDTVKTLLASIEATGTEGEDTTGRLRSRLEAAHRAADVPSEASAGDAPFVPAQIEAAATESLSQTGEIHTCPGATSVVNAHEAIAPSGSQTRVASATETSIAVPAAPTPALEAANTTAIQTLAAAATAPAPAATPAQSGPANAADAPRELQLTDSTIRVDVGLLNRLMNLVGELVLARNQLLQDSSTLNPSLQQTSQRLNLITSELQEGVMKTRMQPIGVVWNKLPRVVRDLASMCGKQIRIEMEGSDTELDKTIIEAIKDPLTHIVRNACDHGIEMPALRLERNKKAEGLLLLRAYHEGGVVNIEISDDGAGINPDRVKAKAVEKGLMRPEQVAQLSVRDAIHLIFLPGFSTAAEVTSISGRGVGMDVVKTNIEKIGGSVEVQNKAEGGTTIRIKIPLTLAIIPGLVVTLRRPDSEGGAFSRRLQGRAHDSTELRPRRRATDSARESFANEERFIIPQANLLELVRVEGADMRRIENVHGTPVFHHRGRLLPLVYLGRILGREEMLQEQAESVNIVVVQAENRQMGLVVDRICDTQEIVVKPLGRQLKSLTCYVGATIMGDGRPALILDVAGLGRLAGLGAQTRQSVEAPAVPADAHPQMMLLFQAGGFKRLAVPLSMVDRLEEVETAGIEQAAGKSVLAYRGDILPLVRMEQVLEHAAAEATTKSGDVHLVSTVSATSSPVAENDLSDKPRGEHTQVIVFTDGRRRVGLIVDQIIDILNEPIAVQRGATLTGLLGSAILGGRITDLVDLHALVLAAGENWLDPSPALHMQARARRQKIVLLDGQSVAREMMHQFLEISGYEVSAASTAAEALPKLGHADVLLADTVLGRAVQQAAAKDLAFTNFRSIALVDEPAVKSSSAAAETDWSFDAQVKRSERVALLAHLAELGSHTSGKEVA